MRSEVEKVPVEDQLTIPQSMNNARKVLSKLFRKFVEEINNYGKKDSCLIKKNALRDFGD